MRRSICLALVAILTPACDSELADSAREKAGAVTDATKAKADAFALKVQDDFLSDLVCSGTLSGSMATRIKEALGAKGGLTTADLLAAPEAMSAVLARAAGILAAQRGSVAALAEVYTQVNVSTLLENGWDSLQCGAPATLPCLVGQATSTVTCTGGKPASLAVSFTACRLSTAVYDGTVAFARGAEAGAAEVTLTAFRPSEAEQLDGKLRLTVGIGKGEVVLQALQPLVAASHQGAEAKKCGRKTTLTVARLAVDTTQVTAEFEGTREDAGSVLGFRSIAKHLAWPYAAKCQCPQPGSGLSVTFPRPYGTGTGPTLTLAFGPAPGGACAGVTATLANWPKCSVFDNATADCGKAATEKLANAVLGALCTSVP